jgi:uncharacterized protein YecT (DUF1311 family)
LKNFFGRLRGFALATAVAATVTDSASAAGPSFDCAGARLRVETAICRSEKLSKLDLRIDAAYRRIMRAWSSDPVAREELRRVQRRFLDDRESAITVPDDGLGRHLEAQATFLEAIDTAPRAGFEGEWGNVAGGLRISREAGGLALWGNAVEPLLFRWICDVEDLGVVNGATFVAPREAISPTHPGWSMRLERVAGMVRVLEVGPPGTETTPEGRALAQTPKCGRRGSFDGTYFPTKNRLRSN